MHPSNSAEWRTWIQGCLLRILPIETAFSKDYRRPKTCRSYRLRPKALAADLLPRSLIRLLTKLISDRLLRQRSGLMIYNKIERVLVITKWIFNYYSTDLLLEITSKVLKVLTFLWWFQTWNLIVSLVNSFDVSPFKEIGAALACPRAVLTTHFQRKLLNEGRFVAKSC